MFEPPSDNLAAIGLEITSLFAQVSHVDGSGEFMGAEQDLKLMIASEADRFELWAVNMGLFVSGHGSLDYRLREAESLKFTFQRFMSDLKESLSEVLEFWCGAIHQTEDETHCKPSSDATETFVEDCTESEYIDPEPDMELLSDSVKDPIDRLYRLSTKIRNPSSRSMSTKASQFQQTDPKTGVDFLQAIAQFDFEHVGAVFLQLWKNKFLAELDIDQVQRKSHDGLDFVDSSEPTNTPSQHRDDLLDDNDIKLVQRIGRANVRRRQQFAYWKHHRAKLTQHVEALGRHVSAPNHVTSTVTDLDQVHMTTMSTISKPVLAHSVTTASRLVVPQPIAIETKSTASVSEYAASAWRPDAEIVDFPSAPKQARKDKYFECPYCFTICSTNILRDKAWKAHIIHDLRPYICTYEHCRTSSQLYDARKDWIQHENSVHRNDESSGQENAKDVDKIISMQSTIARLRDLSATSLSANHEKHDEISRSIKKDYLQEELYTAVEEGDRKAQKSLAKELAPMHWTDVLRRVRQDMKLGRMTQVSRETSNSEEKQDQINEPVSDCTDTFADASRGDDKDAAGNTENRHTQRSD
ncbi:MAG: hypothetical protein Q9160_008317 [Pyrenula sp. 1 TL-2023]